MHNVLERRGRKPIAMDLNQLEKLAAMDCTDEEIARWFEVTVRTIENRRKDPVFAAAMQRGRERALVSRRRSRIRSEQSQKQRTDTQIVGGALSLNESGTTRLTDDEVIQLRGLIVKALSPLPE